ncbi:hypothetical protein [Alkalibacillus silvisoli]|uniref:Uncharacterized protein n=1 Tax=Alkalibacillus silvisoli TaxID=392823 RepID=A0ABN0ZP92_9BACI
MTKKEAELLRRIAEKQLDGVSKTNLQLDALLLYMLKLEGEGQVLSVEDDSRISLMVDDLIQEERDQLEGILEDLKGEG